MTAAQCEHVQPALSERKLQPLRPQAWTRFRSRTQYSKMAATCEALLLVVSLLQLMSGFVWL